MAHEKQPAGSRNFDAKQKTSVRPGSITVRMDNQINETRTWPELAIGLFDKLTGRGAEITYEFDNLQVHVPSSTSATPEHALWRVSGTVRIRTTDAASGARA